jgi:hypothetical protein
VPVVNVAPSNSFDEIGSLAIAISGSQITGSTEQRHIGIFFRSIKEKLQLIHLGWHDRFDCIAPDEHYCWIPCEHIDPVTLDNIADWLATVWRVNGSAIPYSIKPYDSDPFDSAGKLICRELGDGFTCSTFVMWIFHHSYIELLDKASWEDRPEDKIWRQKIIDMLYKTRPKASAHIEAQSEYIDQASRYRPEEVAGAAAIFGSAPIVFNHAKELGECVVLRMSLNGML